MTDSLPFHMASTCFYIPLYLKPEKGPLLGGASREGEPPSRRINLRF